MADRQEQKKNLLILVASVVTLDTIMIGAYFALHVGGRAVKTQQTYVAAWVVLTLIIVTTMMKRIRAARRRR